MSLLSLAEGYIKHGTVFGLVSDKIGLTGKGGLVHDDDEDAVAILHEDCLELVESGLTIPWKAISSWECDDDSQMLFVDHAGGLRIGIPYHRFLFDGDSAELNEKISEMIKDVGSIEDLVPVIAEIAECDDSNQDMTKLDEAFEMLLESKRIFDLAVNESSVVGFAVPLAICYVYLYITLLNTFDTVFLNWDIDRRGEVAQQLEELLDFWTEKVKSDFPDDEVRAQVAQWVAESKYCLRFAEIYVFTNVFDDDDALPEDRAYALEHSFVGDGELRDEKRFIKWCDEEFCLPENAKGRKVIVCTEEKRKLECVGEVLDGVAVFRQRDLEDVIEYQSREDPLDTMQGQRAAAPVDSGITLPAAKLAAQKHVEARKARRLIFEQGHPRNGVTYVQHPMNPNTYIDIESFHASMLERKYNELIGVLTELGAKEISCSVENSASTNSKLREKRSGHAEVGKSCVGSVEVNLSSESDSAKYLSLYKKLDTHLELRPSGERRLPDGLLFYPFEDGWQRLAKEVLAGRLLKASFDLTYRKDYAVTGKYVKALSAKIGSMIPGYDFNVGGGYESELEEELKELESTTWHYEVDFGEPEVRSADSQVVEKRIEVRPVLTMSSAASDDKVESMILGRAKRYAKTEEVMKSGMLTDAQRSDLEKLASKYGVDDFRLEEIIDQAFWA